MATEFVGIELELRGADGVYRDLQEIDRILHSFRGKQKIDAGMTALKKDIVATRGELEKLQREQKKWQDLQKRVGKENMSAFGVREMEKNAKAIQNTKNKLKDLQQAEREVSAATRNMGRTFLQEMNSISSWVAHVGSAMQSLGNALVRITSPMRTITTGLLMGAGYKALNMFTEGLNGAFERYDVMKNYSRTLEAFGFSAEQAQDSIEKLNDSVLGLPTGLDEIVAAQKVYVGATNDLAKSTDIAIAANNTFLASGMGSREQRFVQKYLVALGSGANLAATQWDSMARIAPMAMRAVSKELNYADGDYQQFISDVKKGNVAVEDFLNAFIAVGESGTIADAANVMKMSFEGLSANIQNAAKRMGEGTIKALDEVFQGYNGRTLLQTLLGVDANGKDMGDGVKHWIDNLSQSVQGWIKSHPEEITEFFETLRSIDWAGIIKGFGKGALQVLDIFQRFADWASGKDLSKVGKFMVWANVIGNALLVLGGALKGTRHIWGFLGAGGGFLGKLIGGKVAKTGIFGKIASIFGKKKDITAAGETAEAIPSVADTFKGAFSALQGLMTAAGGIAIVAGTGFVAFKAAKSILTDLKDMVDLVNGGGWDNVGYVGGGIIASIGVFTEIFKAIGEALGPQGLLSVAIAGAASIVVTGSAWADTKLILESLENVKQTIMKFDEIGEAITNMKGLAGLNTGAGSKLQTAVNAIREISDVLGGKNGGPSSRGEYSQGLPMFSNFRVNAVKNIANAIKQLQKIITNINAIAVMGINPNVASRMDQVKRAVQAVEKALPGMMSNINGPKNLANNAKNMATALKGLTSMVKRINALASQSVDVGGFSTLVQGIKDAMAQLEGMSEVLELNIEVKLSTKFGASVRKVINDIKEAKRSISNTKSPLSFNIPVTVTFSVSTNAWSAIAQIREQRAAVQNAKEGAISKTYEAKGGMIYRAGGGGVPWRRRGTDTVPAMLTPGEYVHNRRAVNMFGIDFMRKVNNLDVKGAMNELMHRAGNMANVNRGATITNNYNNNQKVVINNNGNTGAGFTFKSASRFVGAL